MGMRVEQISKSTYKQKSCRYTRRLRDSRAHIEVVVKIVEENHECERETKASLTQIYSMSSVVFFHVVGFKYCLKVRLPS